MKKRSKKKVARKKRIKKTATAKTQKKQKRKKSSAFLRRARRRRGSSATQRLQGKHKTRKKPIKKVKKKKLVKKKPVKKKVAKRKVKPKKRKTVKKRKPIRKAKKRVVRKKKTIKKRLRKKIVKKPKKKIKKVIKRRRRKVKVVRRTYSGGGPLEQLFESPTKTQIMKLFFRNPEANFLLKEAAKIMRNNLASVRREMKRLEKIGLLKSRRISPRKQVFAINPSFDFFNELRELILKASPISREKILKAARGLGKIKLVLLSGLFMGKETARADLLIVGDNINQRKLNTFIKNLEAEAGTDINCVVMTTEEFNYRYDMYDRFVRDLLNEKCEFLINRLGL